MQIYVGNSPYFVLANLMLSSDSPMQKFDKHVEKRSRFLRSVIPICPCERVEFGMFDCLTIAGFLASFIGLMCVLAR